MVIFHHESQIMTKDEINIKINNVQTIWPGQLESHYLGPGWKDDTNSHKSGFKDNRFEIYNQTKIFRGDLMFNKENKVIPKGRGWGRESASVP